ncbi:solute carrier family 2, facilitated glucose transporter member 11-like [Notechis scutatus]|uniref:Solute carrier family 2, facilitated glucose transporter member 5 n=1 Tax=Notechis scutatus TaxID=8663 RepID=A0A6J1VFI2_9SAUR|nr:solute carrier family 2, facilitated glucose transporter member 11-like [Notechis scutatus]
MMQGLFSNLDPYQKFFQMILVLGIGGNFIIGYQISVINYPSVYIKRFMNETWLERTGSPLNEKTLLFLWSFAVSVYGIGGVLGCLCSGFLIMKYGKKKCQLSTDLLVILTTVVMVCSKRAKCFEMILLGRFFYGISAGLCQTIHSQYVGEISPKKWRGLANATSGFFWSLGKCWGQILGLRELLGTDSSWPLLLAFPGVAAFLQLLLLPFFPESPSYLLIQEGDEDGCLKAMHQLWGQGNHQEELGELKKEMAPGGQRSKVLWPGELLRDASLRQQLSILVAVIVTVQLCGINTVYFYAFEVLQSAGLEERLIPYICLGIGFSELFSSFLCIFTIEQYGRRPLLWKGCGSMALVLFFLTGTLSLQKNLPWMSLCSVILIFLLVILFGVGPNGASFSIMMEIFSQSARPAAFTIGGCLNWAALFVIGIAFPFAEESLGPFCFLLFAIVLSGSGIFFYLFLPETKGKSAVEITEEFSKSSLGKKLAVLRKNFNEDHSVYSSF